jgi:tellurite resistance protein TerC
VTWLLFAATVAVLLIVDLGILSRRAHLASLRESVAWSIAVMVAAALFAAWIWARDGRAPALQFASGYIVELALSVDNLLVFLIILRYFAVPASLQPTVLKWGILGALVMRGLMIGAGILLLDQFRWIIYLLGALLVFTGIRMFDHDEPAIDPARHPLLRRARRFFPMGESFDDAQFVTRTGGRRIVTPLLIIILVIELTDLVFATDSIPAIFAITRNPLLVYSSNIFAIVGLRALYFVLASMLARFAYLRTGVAMILVLVGAKMLAERWVTIAPEVVLGVVVAILAGAVVASPKPATTTAPDR